MRVIVELLVFEDVHLRVLEKLNSSFRAISADDDFFGRFLGHTSEPTSILVVFKNLLLILSLTIANEELKFVN